MCEKVSSFWYEIKTTKECWTPCKALHFLGRPIQQLAQRMIYECFLDYGNVLLDLDELPYPWPQFSTR